MLKGEVIRTSIKFKKMEKRKEKEILINGGGGEHFEEAKKVKEGLEKNFRVITEGEKGGEGNRICCSHKKKPCSNVNGA